MMKNKGFKTGIVLSGGGAHGMAHAGIFKALNEDGVYPDLILGVSAGAMVGVLYAKGIPPDHILEIFTKEKIFKYPGLNFKNRGLLNGSKTIDRLIGNRDIHTFNDLEIPLIITTSNFNKGMQGAFSSGDIYKPLCATISVPILFSGVEIDGDLHYDGGLIDNLPVELIRDKCDTLIGVNVNPITRVDKFESLQELVIRTAHIGITARLKEKTGICDLFIEPKDIYKHPILNDSRLKETFDAGYHFTRELLSTKKMTLQQEQ